MGKKIGAPRKEVDTEILFDLMEKGTNRNDIAEELEISPRTLSTRIVEIQEKQGLILKYRSLQNLQLTELQAEILEHITPDKIEEAPLRDLVFAYKVLKDKELVEVGKPTDIKGMMHYLVELEKQEMAVKEPVKDITPDEDVVDLEETMDGNFADLKKTMPNL